jgi:hypothetical protein
MARGNCLHAPACAPSHRSTCTTRRALCRPLPLDCHQVADQLPPFSRPHVRLHMPRPYPSTSRQEKHRTTLSPLSRASSLCRAQHRSHAAHRHCSGPAVRSLPQAVPRPCVELSVQPCRREEPHRGVLRCDVVLVSAPGTSMITAFCNGSSVQPNHPRASPHPRSGR